MPAASRQWHRTTSDTGGERNGDGVVSGERGVTPFTRDILGIASCEPGPHLTQTSTKKTRVTRKGGRGHQCPCHSTTGSAHGGTTSAITRGRSGGDSGVKVNVG